MLNICSPALFNLILSSTAIVLMVAFNFNVKQFVSSSLYTVVWTYLIDMLCNNGHYTIAWFLVLFPFIVIILVLLFFFSLFTGINTAAAVATSNKEETEKAKESLIIL